MNVYNMPGVGNILANETKTKRLKWVMDVIMREFVNNLDN